MSQPRWVTADTTADTVKRHSEDTWGRTANTFWIIDGATTPTSTNAAVARYTHTLSACIAGVAAAGATDPQTILAEAIGSIDARVCGGHSAAVAVIVADGDNLTYTVLADVTCAAATADGIVTVTDNRLATYDAPIIARRNELVAEGADPATMLDTLAEHVAAQRATARNTPGGYWAAVDNDPTPVAFAHHGTLTGVDAFLLATDGFTRTDTADGCPTVADVLTGRPPLRDVTAAIRRWETRHHTSAAFGHLVAHDDITAALFVRTRQ